VILHCQYKASSPPMSSRADIYRQKAAEINQSAARAKNPSTKRAFEEVARGWLLLAEPQSGRSGDMSPIVLALVGLLAYKAFKGPRR
jgi:hypothetical protein